MSINQKPKDIVNIGKEELLNVLGIDQETFEAMDLDNPIMLNNLIHELYNEAIRDVSMEEFESDPNEGLPDEE